MKYLITILAIICAVTMLTLYFVWPDQVMDTKNVAVTINGHDLAKSTVATEGARAGYHGQDDYAELLDSAITRELLIQEAQRQNLDKEESFRIALKTFYEESLIKTLMDREYRMPEVKVNNAEINAYLSMFAQMVTFTRLPVTTSDPKVPASEEGPQNDVLFDDLAEPLKFLISGLKLGEYAIKVDTGNEQYAIRLDKVTPVIGMMVKKPERDHVRRILEECKRQQQISDWLKELRNKASITIHNG
jgi:hypothetical protein